MKIDIIGRHPTIQPGFCGVMSLYEARHLAVLGHDVKLVIPFRNRQSLTQTMEHHKLGSLADLLLSYDDFAIEPVFLDERITLRETDATIWQTTEAEEWHTLHPIVQKNSTVMTKNFPKTVRGAPAPLSAGVTAQFKAFDLVTFALKEDYQNLWQYPDFAMQNQHKFAYVPRGADPELLHNSHKSPQPIIAVDTPNTIDLVGIEHLLKPLQNLKEIYPDLQVLTLGGTELNLNFSKKLNYMPYDGMYSSFMNPAAIYCVVDYSQSPAHIKGAIHSEDRSWDSKAIYEVQTVEAQMAGCIIAGFQKNIIPELVEPKCSLLWGDFETADSITESMHTALQNRDALSREVRARAEHQFTWEAAISAWEHRMLNLIDNGYKRTRKTFKGTSITKGDMAVNPNSEGKSTTSPVAALNPDEKQLLHTLIGSCRRFVEFGCGGSTKIAATTNVGHIESIETDINWIKALAADPEIVPQIESGRLRFHHIDIGPTKEWGYPVKMDVQLCSRYTKAPWSSFPLEDIDAVLVDGRFRVATALEAALRTEAHCLIIVDNYLDQPHFEELEKHLDIITSASRMVVFNKGKNWNRHIAFETLENFRLDPR